jgi:hypothetical protein
MLTGLKFLTDDPSTKVIALISSRHREIADEILGMARVRQARCRDLPGSRCEGADGRQYLWRAYARGRCADNPLAAGRNRSRPTRRSRSRLEFPSWRPAKYIRGLFSAALSASGHHASAESMVSTATPRSDLAPLKDTFRAKAIRSSISATKFSPAAGRIP